MQAMIFAAGLGTRLKPLTLTKPKALVQINGKTLLERNIEKMISYGIKRIVVNIYHFPDMMAEFIESIRSKYNCDIIVSDERQQLLNTGGGFLRTKDFFFDDNTADETEKTSNFDDNEVRWRLKKLFTHNNLLTSNKNKFFSKKNSGDTDRVGECSEKDLILLHNVDILSDIDFSKMRQNFIQFSPLALLAVKQRTTQRYFIFNEKNELSGWTNIATNQKIMTRKCKKEYLYAFSGVHIVRKDIFDFITQEGAFSITDMYLELSKNHIIRPFIDDSNWLDVGKIDAIKKAEEMF